MWSDPRQFGREVGTRRAQADTLRGELAAQGVDVAPLDKVIAEMRELERTGTANPGKIDQLQNDIIAGLKAYQFDLWRRFNAGASDKPALGAADAVPPEFRAMVEQYYRSLARPDSTPH